MKLEASEGKTKTSGASPALSQENFGCLRLELPKEIAHENNWINRWNELGILSHLL